MTAAARLGLKAGRSTLLWSSLLGMALAASLLVVAFAFESAFADHQPCDADLVGSGCGQIGRLLQPWWGPQQSLVGLLWILPIVVGALLGVAVTGAELESHSAQITWSLSTSRRRWLLLRIAPVAATLVVILAVCAGAVELVTRARLVTDQPGFVDYELRSVLVPLRGLLALATGVAFGALIGRRLPAMLVAVAFSAAITVGLIVFIDWLHQGSATFMAIDDLVRNEYPMIVSNGVSEWPQGTGVMHIPVSEFGLWVALEAAVFTVFTVGIAIIADGIVRSRSPR